MKCAVEEEKALLHMGIVAWTKQNLNSILLACHTSPVCTLSRFQQFLGIYTSAGGCTQSAS
jgi:hypothetical protein